jgi:hypothetical protein
MDMKRNWVLRGIKFALFALIFVIVFSVVVMRLWNWLIPPVFGWHVINFWQAVGLFVLSKILFGGFHGRSGRNVYWRRRMIERWEQMTPEEREKFRQGIRGHCGSFGEPAAAPKA